MIIIKLLNGSLVFLPYNSEFIYPQIKENKNNVKDKK